MDNMARSIYLQWGLFLTVALNSLYLFLFSEASILYAANIILHPLLGLALIVIFYRVLKNSSAAVRWLTILFSSLCVVSGLAIAFLGNLNSTSQVVLLHSLFSLPAVIIMGIALFRWHASPIWKWGLAVAVLIGLWGWASSYDKAERYFIQNEGLPAETMAGDAMGGEEGPFFPSPVETSDGKLIPAEFFTESKTCGRSGCHPDIYSQWEASAHHFASFNNQWYRKSIEYMQQVAGTEAAQWCSGCHDQALLFSGQMNQPVANFLNTRAAQAGIGCVGCHNIVDVKHTMGNGGYIIEHPALHEMIESDNQLITALHDLVLHLDPAPHKETFLKPFHREQSSEFCATCHKVHLDKPVNNYRWVRGFNTYDNWQASGVSGQGARSFYYPASPKDCADCHMPKVPSNDAGNVDGMVHSHRFTAANTALPVANGDSIQQVLVRAFLKQDQLTVDLFALSEGTQKALQQSAPLARGAIQGAGNLASTFAVGEESGFQVGSSSAAAIDKGTLHAPLYDGQVVEPGKSYRLDAVVRTRGLGHFFPTGTVDAQEAWLEIKASDETGKVFFWSGRMDPETRIVDPAANFYRNFMVDANGNPINKRNAFAARAVVYVNLIPPGAADVGHYRINIPDDISGKLTVVAKVNYRKFNRWHTQWAYAGVRTDEDADYSPDYDDGEWNFSGDLSKVSGKLKEIPQLPVVVMATDTLVLEVGSETSAKSVESEEKLWERWNDYGIGLLREGDMRGAEEAFEYVSRLKNDATGWINLARVYLREGNLDKAEQVLNRAAEAEPTHHQIAFFRGMLYKARGEYDAALKNFAEVEAKYPKDRVLLNQIGRVYYLDARPDEAPSYFERVLKIDPEDLMAHYNLMLVYRAIGNSERSKEHEKRYLRYKEDENSQAIAGRFRQENPYENNMAQPIREHVSSTF